jgi:hypothetical protein
MIAPNACGGKGFAGGNVAQRFCAISPSTGTGNHALVKQFIERPDFSRGQVNLICDTTIVEFGSVRVPDSSAPQPPGTCTGRLLLFRVRFNPPTLWAGASRPFFLVRVP